MTEKQKLRWYQFSLRALLVFVLLISVGMSWLGGKLQRARRQREAVEVIEKLGGYAGYEQTRSPILKWARAVFGWDLFLDVACVNVPGSDFGDDEMAHLKELTELERLDLSHTQVTDAGLEHLAGLTSLPRLILNGTQITDVGLEHLEGLTSLTELGLSQTQVTDAGLEYLEGMTNIEFLDLTNTQVTDAGLEHLEGLTKLHVLSLNGTQVTDAGLEHLEGLTRLWRLELSRTQVTDEGVESLRQSLPNCVMRAAYSRTRPRNGK